MQVSSLKRELVQLKSSVANADVLKREVGCARGGQRGVLRCQVPRGMHVAAAAAAAAQRAGAQRVTHPSTHPPIYPPHKTNIQQVHHLNRELLAERSKVKALSEELENPLNVHRCVWVWCGGGRMA